jgi:hypothetical protein
MQEYPPLTGHSSQKVFMSLRDEAKVKMKCTCPEQDNKEKYGSFQVQNDVSASIRQ